MGGPAEIETRLKAKMLAALDGDAVAYRGLLDELGRMLRAYFLRRLAEGGRAHAEDLMQDTLMAIHTRRQTYDRTLPFTAWVHAVARYKLIDHSRRQRIRVSVPLDEDALLAPDLSGDAAARFDVKAVLDTIPARPAELIRRTRIEGATVAEAAAGLGMTETAAKVSIHRGLKALTARFAGGRKP